MYELIEAGARTFYFDAPAKVGAYLLPDNGVLLIDSGSDKDAAKKILRICAEKGWTVSAILATHSHADHIGGNQVIQNKTGCPIDPGQARSGIPALPAAGVLVRRVPR